MTPTSLVAASAVIAVTATVAHRTLRRAPAYVTALGALATFVLVAVTRRTWESAVRRPRWLLDAALGLWLERGVDWLVAASALALAGALAHAAGIEHRRAARVAWACAACLATAAASAILWGNH
jgi:hypothetical protein